MTRTRRKDWLIVALVGSFFLANAVIDTYWLIHAHELPKLAATEWRARIYRDYAVADRGYYDRVSKMELGLEAINCTVTQLLNLALIWSVIRKLAWRYPLQLALGTYVTYSVVFDYWVAFISGFPNMAERSLSSFVLFFGASLPWLLGHSYLMWDAARAVHARIQETSLATAPPRRI
jgi:hypothetical protein